MSVSDAGRFPPSPLGSRRNTLKTVDKSPGSTLSRGMSLLTDVPVLVASPVQSTVHPPITDLGALDEYIQGDPSNLVQVFPAISQLLTEYCLTHPDTSLDMWAKLKVILEGVQKHASSPPAQPERPASPTCARKPVSSVNVHGETWEDDYGWLTDRNDPDVLKYIEEENDYALKVLEGTKPLQKLLYKEFVSRIDEDEHSVRVTLQDGWTYYTKKVAGKEYLLHCRVKDGKEDVYLDENDLADSPEFEDASSFKLGFLKHSPDCKLIAYGIDCTGNERNSVYFMEVDSRRVLDERIEGVYEDLEFAQDNESVYYTLLDECERAYKFMRHRLGTKVELDDLLYHEEDEMFFLAMTKTSDGEYIRLSTSAQITSETWCISTSEPNAPLRLLFPRRDKIQYTCESHGGYFYILTNEETKNNWLFRIPAKIVLASDVSADDRWKQLEEHREMVIEHRDFVLIEGFQLRRKHLIVLERSNCLQNVRIIDLSREGFNSYHYISFGETVYSLWPGTIGEEERSRAKASQFDTTTFRFTYTSLVQPKQVVDYDMNTREMQVVYEEHISGYDQNLYASRRLYATSVDGTTVPVSLVYRRDLLALNATDPGSIPINPCLLHAYGAYGCFINPVFSSARLSLLDRGFVWATAHVRGGADLGNGWYEEGKLGKKPNTFLDFCSVAEYLCKEGYTSPERLAIYGRSAGGLLIGAALNMRPELFAVALTEVPFVDVVNTMFDASIPWTAFEWEEWGNPTDKAIYDVMKTYCPYSNIRGEALAKNAYPHVLVVGGMNDPRVAFFEPLKFVAKMRGERRRWLAKDAAKNTATDSSHEPNPDHGYFLAAMAGGTAVDADLPTRPTPSDLLLRIEDSGHGSSSGQYSFLENLAFEYAFVISRLNAQATETAHDGSNHGHAHPPPSLKHQVSFGPGSSALRRSTSRDGEDKEKGSAGKTKRRFKKRPDLGDVEEREYRHKNKGDRGPSNLFQWVQNFF
ncbi:hypothetical protein HKX48_008173 [Thoreauomyces humboldtii]|nr:hypothetical protein HKX48_008173 [Thoreauomyces humboldtii]